MTDKDSWLSCEIVSQLKNGREQSKCSDLLYQEGHCCLSMFKLGDARTGSGARTRGGQLWSRAEQADWDWIAFL